MSTHFRDTMMAKANQKSNDNNNEREINRSETIEYPPPPPLRTMNGCPVCNSINIDFRLCRGNDMTCVNGHIYHKCLTVSTVGSKRICTECNKNGKPIQAY